MAFSWEVKKEVQKRAGGFVSELSGRIDRPPEHIHLVHGRSKLLDVPENCLLGIDMEHLAHHLYWYENPKEIGLTKAQNIWSINQITARVTQFSYAQKRLHEYDEDLSACLGGWEIYYQEHERPSEVYRQLILPSLNIDTSMP